MDKQRLKELAKFILQLLALDDLLQSPLPVEDIIRLENEIQHLVIDGMKYMSFREVCTIYLLSPFQLSRISFSQTLLPNPLKPLSYETGLMI